MNPLYQQMTTSVFERMSLAAAENDAVNLGQGFPDFGWPDAIIGEAARALNEGSNQYAPSRGLYALRQAVAAHYNRQFGEELTPDHICITSGATEALGASILATIKPGDEVILFTPAYDSYAPMIRRAGGNPVEVQLQPPHWRIHLNDLEAAVSPRTRAILFNNPHNPTGKIFSKVELLLIADVARAHDLIVISDEVWEHVILGGPGFVPIATLPGMSERSIKVGSAGKIFSLTGWKVGWIAASPRLADVVAKAHQFLTFATPPNLQTAVAFGLSAGDEWLAPMKSRFRRARDRMAAGLCDRGYAVLDSQATYFMCIDLQASGIDAGDEQFAQEAVKRAGVAVIPLSPFAEHKTVSHLVRLCFAKQDQTIDAGIEAMGRARELFA